MLLPYVDDLFVTGMDGFIAGTKRNLTAEFEMKHLGMMHYFLSMEVWQNADGISLGQGKYAVEILNRFGMMEYKAIATPMASNLKLLNDASSESLDATMYHQMIGSLMYLANTRPNICFCCEHVEPILDRSEKCSLDCCKAYSEIPEGYS